MTSFSLGLSIGQPAFEFLAPFKQLLLHLLKFLISPLMHTEGLGCHAVGVLVDTEAAAQSNITTRVGLSLLRVSFETTASPRCACQQGKLRSDRFHSCLVFI